MDNLSLNLNMKELKPRLPALILSVASLFLSFIYLITIISGITFSSFLVSVLELAPVFLFAVYTLLLYPKLPPKYALAGIFGIQTLIALITLISYIISIAKVGGLPIATPSFIFTTLTNIFLVFIFAAGAISFFIKIDIAKYIPLIVIGLVVLIEVILLLINLPNYISFMSYNMPLAIKSLLQTLICRGSNITFFASLGVFLLNKKLMNP